MERLILQRRHSTGIVAQVYGETEGAGYRAGTSPAVVATTIVDLSPYVDTIAEAQESADDLAHPGCTGDGCERWMPHITTRPPE